MKTVYDLFHSCNKEEVFSALFKEYRDEFKNYKGYEEAWAQILALDPVHSELQCKIDYVKDILDPNLEYYNISGFDGETNYAIEFKPWNEWLSMEVVTGDIGDKEISDVEFLSHILYEMTFVGYEETSIKERLDYITESITQLEESYKDFKE